VFGLSFGELMVLLIVAVVVLGPKELPRYLRKAGQFAGQIRRMASDMRQKSGIDEVLRTEGIDRDLAEIRRLARGELGGVATAVRSVGDAARPGFGALGAPAPSPPATAAPQPAPFAPGAPGAPVDAYSPTQVPSPQSAVDREREYPREGADSYGALPDTALVYDGSLPASPLADDALYARGEAA
jgi:sec-independent protein translocase protein TatB